jgi:diacylglycerol kinase family enzyme
MTAFDRAVLIFNPNSTGNAPELAQQLKDDLASLVPELEVVLSPTEHAGHGRDLAREAAATGRPLLVSVSGDGGYNEVVDGAMKADNPDVVCAVMASGNANDHRRSTAERPLAEAIAEGQVKRIDLLALTIGSGAEARTQYAHSYIGVGLTPVVAVDLEKGGKGSLREIVTVVRTFSRFRPFAIELEDGTTRRIDSLLFANIAEMAKVATLSDDGSPEDGRFEVISIPHSAKWRVLGVALKAAVRGLGPQPTATHYGFTTLKPMPLQLDGEVLPLEAGTAVSVDIAPGALATVT